MKMKEFDRLERGGRAPSTAYAMIRHWYCGGMSWI